MKKHILTAAFAFGSFVGAYSQISLPSAETIKKEEQQIKTEVKTEAATAVAAAKTTVSGANTSELISLIKSKVNLTADQTSKIQAIASKIDLSKLSNPKDQLKSLLSNADFSKIFSSDQLTKLKSAVTSATSKLKTK